MAPPRLASGARAAGIDSAAVGVLSQVLELTSGPAIVQSLGYTTPVNSVTAMRGSLPVVIQTATSGSAAALPSGARMYYGVKLASALKGDWLALCELTASTDENLPGVWTGTLLLNTPPMRTAMHADVDDPIVALTSLDCLAEVYYTVPGQADPVLAYNHDFVVNGPLFNGTEGIAPNPNVPYPPASKLNAVVSSAVRNYSLEATVAVDQRIAGKTASAATRAIFSAADNTAHVYTRNPNLWCPDLAPTCLSAFVQPAGGIPPGGGSSSIGWRITMITPRHGLTARHIFMAPGAVGYWVDANNNTYARTVTAVTNVIGDMDLVTLDSDLPAAIAPAAILPAQLPNGFLSGPGSLIGCPVIGHDQNNHLCIDTLVSLRQGTPLTCTLSMPTTGPYVGWNRNNDTVGNTAGSPAILNDSSSPYFLYVGGELVLLGCFYSTQGLGPEPGANAALLQTAIGNSYSLKLASMPGYPFPFTVNPTPNVTSLPSNTQATASVSLSALGEMSFSFGIPGSIGSVNNQDITPKSITVFDGVTPTDDQVFQVTPGGFTLIGGHLHVVGNPLGDLPGSPQDSAGNYISSIEGGLSVTGGFTCEGILGLTGPPPSPGTYTPTGTVLVFPLTSDPLIAGALWNDNGTPRISAGD